MTNGIAGALIRGSGQLEIHGCQRAVPAQPTRQTAPPPGERPCARPLDFSVQSRAPRTGLALPAAPADAAGCSGPGYNNCPATAKHTGVGLKADSNEVALD
jgi:hypothetical protein